MNTGRNSKQTTCLCRDTGGKGTLLKKEGTWCLTSTETIRLIGDGEKGKGVWRWGKREIICLSLHCHHQNDSCIKMGSDESHFNVSLCNRVYCVCFSL